MEAFVSFYSIHGIWLTAIAILGVVLLGILKYANVFSKLEETARHYVYIIVSVGFSIIGAVAYMLIADCYDTEALSLFIINVYSLNQMFYTTFKATKINDLATSILDGIGDFINRHSSIG